MPGTGLPTEGMSELRAACHSTLEEYIQELKKATELLMLANDSDTDLQRFLSQRDRETQAYERYREARRRYDDVVRRSQKETPGGSSGR